MASRIGIVIPLVSLLLSACATAPPVAPIAAAPSVVAKPAPPPLPDWRDAVIYFVVLDRFADGDDANNVKVNVAAKGAFHGGDLEGLIGRLDDLHDLGVTAIWVTPVVKNIDGFVTGAGFPDWGYHGYWADDFNTLDPRIGTEAELKTLVDESHARGMRVLLDVVYNHAGYNSKYLKDPATKSWLRNNEVGDCGQDDITSCLAGLPDFKTELPEVRDYLLKAHIGLAKRVGLDGFRLDTVKHVTHDFWQEHRRRTRAELGNDFFLVGEVWGGDAGVLDPWFSGDEMDAGFDFGFQGSDLAWVQGRGRTIAFAKYLKSREKVRAGYHLSHYLSSHDTPGALYQLEGDKDLFRLAAIVQLTTSGIPTIYYGEEVARAGGDWPANRSDMPWGAMGIKPGAGVERDEAMRALYKTLLATRSAHKAFSRGTMTIVSTDGDLLVYQMADAASGDVAVVAVNRGAEAASAKFAAPAAWTSSVGDALTGDAIAITEGNVEVTVPPRGARIVVPKGAAK
ncbi:MAG: alpha-amylase family glycosyl hydrolase [Thermoanaerobaculia bacterium]|jgi:alpha-amylase